VQVGDLITVDYSFYPRLKGEVGILVRRHGRGWVVHIGGRLHPFAIEESSMELHSVAA